MSVIAFFLSYNVWISEGSSSSSSLFFFFFLFRIFMGGGVVMDRKEPSLLDRPWEEVA